MIRVMEVQKGNTEDQSQLRLYQFYYLAHFAGFVKIHHRIFGEGGNSAQWARASSFTRFLNHIQRSTTAGRTPLDEWSALRRDLYLTTHSTHNRQTSVPPGGIRTHNLGMGAAADLRLRPRDHWDGHQRIIKKCKKITEIQAFRIIKVFICTHILLASWLLFTKA